MTNIRKLFRLTVLARMVGIPQQTLHSAAERGDLPTETTGCGIPLATEAAAKKFAEGGERRGRPRKDER